MSDLRDMLGSNRPWAERGIRVPVRAVALLILAWTALGGCASPPKPAPPSAEAASRRAQSLIDSGNQAVRAGEYAVAAKRFASAAVVDPEDPAAFYGLGMALAKLGRDDEARVAYAKARELSRGEIDAEAAPHEIRYRRTRNP